MRPLISLISSLKKSSVSRHSGRKQDTYATIFASGLLGLSFVMLLVVFPPTLAKAFWPFSVTFAASNEEPPIIHDSTMRLLEAATNPDPNPLKGGLDIAVSEGSALIASAGPEGTLPAAIVAPSATNIATYLVRQGDSVSAIADMFGVSVNTILWANNLKSAKDVAPGDTLIILPVSGLKHTVLKGQTLAGIAKKYGADITEVATFNDIDASEALAAGTELVIPGGEVAKTAATTKKTMGGGLGKLTGASSVVSGIFSNPVPGAILTQGIHGTNGIDLGAPSGTPIYAAAGGSVIISKTEGWNGGYGSYVVISHPNGMQTLYAHMSKDVSSVGETVSAGDLIGYVGRTGIATGNHLHFEVRGGKNPFAGCRTMSVCSFK